MAKLKGKTAIITGGNSGMGLETAKLLAAEGANIVITGRRQAELDNAVKQIGSNAIGVQSDVSVLTDLDRLYAIVKDKFGTIDIVFANAGIGLLSPVDVVTEDHFDQQFNINVKGLFFTVQKALPLLNNNASIILNASIAGYKGMNAFSVYSATKAAVRSFSRSWTVDLKERGIRVNAISPGPIETPIYGKMGLTMEQAAGFSANIVQSVPLGRMGQPGEVAKAVLFLASDDSSYITGIDLSIDGGMAQI